MKQKSLLTATVILMFSISCSNQKWSEYENGDFRFVEHRNGPTLGYSSASGVGAQEGGRDAHYDFFGQIER